ncbi:AAA family ATPase (macronuclear) [Tetrahymena thermophila SB210]|uniref:AAA family ATPase n=1 Tax=Tetrahymena thermophila (strain SB210) TaxID=312017 RepID=Q236J5_TETTS|nr:AAA family ATPase [Tetrahymena thermophila SB210]EAR92505.2 AAA family ATPase [Tetrahymena thermophila SB210]|eukprot:XP_001012750.2 AAA family ATPase [Tetrahymena thermophila SB210]
MLSTYKDAGDGGLQQDNLIPMQKETLKSILSSFKNKMNETHQLYSQNSNSLQKEDKEDVYKHAFSFAFLLQKYQEKDNSLCLEDFIQEAERMRDHQLYKPSKANKKFNIMPKISKEKFEQFIEYEKDTRFPQPRKTVQLNTQARLPERQTSNQKPAISSLLNSNNNQISSNSNQGYGNINSFQNNPNNSIDNNKNNNNNFGPTQQNNNNGFYRSQSSQNQDEQPQKTNGYKQQYNNGYNSYQNQNTNNFGYGRNRYQNNNRYNKGREQIEEEQDEQQQAGGFKTASEQRYQNNMLKRQKEEGFYNKETGKYGRNNGQLEFEGVNDNKPKYGYTKYGSNQGVDDVVNLVHYHTIGKNLNLNNNSSSNQAAALNGGGTEDEYKKTGLSRKFKPPGAPGSNTGGKKNEQCEQLKGMDQKLIDLIENEIVENAANVKWEDIAGLSSAKESVKETIVWPMLNPQIFTGIRAPPKGLLLFGPPGTGKTMIGKAIANQSGSTFFSISASSLTSKYIGEGEKMVKILFKLAEMRQPSVIFIDEIDSLLCARQENENEASRRIKTEFLVQMEGATSREEVRLLLIGATNRPQELDDAVRRRFVKKLYIPLPNMVAREQLIRRVIERESAKGNAFDMSDQDILEVVQATKGFSGADMTNLCKEAALIPIRQCTDITNIQSSDIRPINKSDFVKSLKQVKATVTSKDLAGYFDWNNQFGSFEINMEEIDS